MRIYSIYKITNNTNSKSYVGKTNKEVEKRFNEHLKSSEKGSKFILHSAIRKYGPDNFSIEILFQSTSDLISEKEFTTVYEPLLIDQHKSYHKEYGYNMTRGGEGFDSETAKDTARKLVENGTHALLRRPDGTSVGKDQAILAVKNNTHPFQTRPDGTNIQTDRIESGIFHFQKRSDGSSISADMVADGTHNLLNTINCVNRVGLVRVVPKEQYYCQYGSIDDFEWVSVLSKEGLQRLNKTHPCLKQYRVYNIITNEEYVVNTGIKSFCKNKNIKYTKMLYDTSYCWKYEII